VGTGFGQDREIELRLQVSGDSLRGEVLDPGGVEFSSVNRLGLLLVDRLADRWGVSEEGEPRAWFEIDRDPASLRRKALLFKHVSDAVIVLDLDRRIVEWNPSAEVLFGYSRTEVVGRTPDFLFEGEGPVEELDVGAAPAEVRFTRADRSRGTCQLVAVPLLDDDSGLAGLTLLVRDLTERRRMEAMLLQAEEKFRTVVEAAPDSIVGVDAIGQIVLVNRQAESMLGYTRRELLGQSIDMIWPERCRAEYTALLRERIVGGSAEPMGELIGLRKDGTEFPTDVWVNVVDTDHGPLVLCSGRDVTARVKLERRLEYLADHDELTALLNRRGFRRELTQWLAFAGRYGGKGALLVIDLDGFKGINDTLGHRAGDICLCSVASVLHRRLRATDVVGRLGGDEFAVLLPHAEKDQAHTIARELLGAVGAQRPKYSSRTMSITASIGVATFDARAVTAEELMDAADAALYSAKADGRDRVAALDLDAIGETTPPQ
jgi:diguanylate cyclase (GGDEF)-like protein/PAS domain S-box-containing protein